MTIVESLAPPSVGLLPVHWSTDTLTLPWEDRCRSHGKRRTDSGLEFAVALPSGTILRDGDQLLLETEQCRVRVQAAPEPVFVLTPISPQEWAWLAYQVGNRHLPLMISHRELLTPQDAAAEHLLRQLGVTYQAAHRAFTPATPHSGHSH